MGSLYNEEEEKKLLFRKKIKCPCCEESFEDLRTLNSKLRRLESDDDLRPRFQNIDSLKYGVTSCPYCGYSAPWKNFDSLSKLEKYKLVEKVCSQFVEREPNTEDTWGYDTAIEQYKLAMLCAMIMEKEISNQAYICLQLSWLLRGKIEEMEAEGTLTESQKESMKKDEDNYYRRAYDGLVKASLQEDFPICGMDQPTFYYLLAVISFKYDEYEDALRYCGLIVQERSVNAKIKDKTLMLKDKVVKAKKAAEEAEEA